MFDVLPLSLPRPGAVLTGIRRHVRVEGSASGARHRPGRRRGQLLCHREVRLTYLNAE